MSRVLFAAAGAGDAPAVVADRAWRLCAEVLETAGPAAGTPLACHLDRPARSCAARQFAGWTAPILDRLRERSHEPTPLPPVTAPDPRHVEVPVADGVLTPVRVSSVLHGAEGLFLARRLTHHPVSGLDGALAGLAYAALSAAGKRDLQAGLQPHVDPSLCGGCGMCVALCDRGGIRYNGHVSEIQPANCLVCGDCRLECATLALRFPPGAGPDIQRRMAAVAAAAAAGKAGRMLWLLFLIDEPERHGVNLGRRRPWPDLGILAGDDPVALDCAARDLVEAETGRPLHGGDGEAEAAGVLIEEAERLGVGSSSYRLVSCD